MTSLEKSKTPVDEKGNEILFCPDCGKETAKEAHSKIKNCSEWVSYLCSECGANFWRIY